MFSAPFRTLDAYAKVGVETGVSGADPHQLILMLYEGALLALADGRLHMTRGEIAAKGQSISKAINIIENGLRASLDFEAGDELAARLAALYQYMCDRLLRANLRNEPAIIDEVSRLLSELRDAWSQIKPAQAPSPSGKSRP